MTLEEALAACLARLRAEDRDRFLTLSFLPTRLRGHGCALFAFMAEIAKTREVVSDPMLGEIRLQWWRDRVREIHIGEVARHEVLIPLAAAMKSCSWDEAPLQAMIDARSFDLDDAPPETLGDLESYIEDTAARPLRLLLDAAGVGEEAARAAMRHVGLAYGLVGIVRAVPVHARQGRCYLPADMLGEAGLSAGAVTGVLAAQAAPSQDRAAAIEAVMARLLDRVREHLAFAASYRRATPRRADGVLIAGLVADHHRRRLLRLETISLPAAAAQPAPMLPAALARGWFQRPLDRLHATCTATTPTG